MTTPRTPLTLIVPCFNEASRLDADAFRDFAAKDDRVDFLFVDDGSADATLDKLRALETSTPGRARVLALPSNVGKGEAVRRGLLHALASAPLPKAVGFWDADLATPLDEVPRFLEVLRSNADVDLVVGSRVKLMGRQVERRSSRHYLGRVFATAASSALQLPIYDTQCGAKVLRVCDWTLGALHAPFVSPWLFDVELIARVVSRAAGGNHAVYELPLLRWSDVAGSKLRARDYLRSAMDLVIIRFAYPHARTRPRGRP